MDFVLSGTEKRFRFFFVVLDNVEHHLLKNLALSIVLHTHAYVIERGKREKEWVGEGTLYEGTL